jgi:hypothetical protein
MFITLEDETANANLIVWPSVFEENRRAFLGATLLGCWGRVQTAPLLVVGVKTDSGTYQTVKTACLSGSLVMRPSTARDAGGKIEQSICVVLWFSCG